MQWKNAQFMAWMFVGLLISVSLVWLSGCNSHQRGTLVKAAAPHQATMQVKDQYAVAEDLVDAGKDVIREHLPEMPTDDRVAIQIAYTEAIRTQAAFKQALDTENTEQLKMALKSGVDAYQRGVPVIVKHRELFTTEEWRVLAEANAALITVYREALQLQDAKQFRAAAIKVYSLVRFAASIAL